MSWLALKANIVLWTGLEKDALHIYGALAAQLATAALLRRPLSSLAPWLGVLVFELINELGDLLIETWPDRMQQYYAGLHDAINTLALPTLIMLAARFQPSLFGGSKPGGQ